MQILVTLTEPTEGYPPEVVAQSVLNVLRDDTDLDDDGYHFESATVLPALPETAELVLNPTDDDTGNAAWTCPCGSQQFTYDESHPSPREMIENDRDGILFSGDGQCSDGDDDPGVVCAHCGTIAIVPETCEMGFA